MKKLRNFILSKLLKRRTFYTCDIAEDGDYYSVFRFWEIDKDGIIKLKKIIHSSK